MRRVLRRTERVTEIGHPDPNERAHPVVNGAPKRPLLRGTVHTRGARKLLSCARAAPSEGRLRVQQPRRRGYWRTRRLVADVVHFASTHFWRRMRCKAGYSDGTTESGPILLRLGDRHVKCVN